jgi:CBS-domain-containing membrane protein
MLLAVTGAMVVAREIESRSIYSIRLPAGHREGAARSVATSTVFDHLISHDYRVISAATNYAEVVRLLLTDHTLQPLYVVDHEGHLMGRIDSTTVTAAKVGAMPIEATQAGDIVATVEPIRTDMQINDVLRRIGQSIQELPVIDAKAGTLLGVIPQTRATT